MNFTLPIYVQERRTEGAPTPVFAVRPLFRAEPVREAEKLNRALTLLAGDVRQALAALVREPDHRPLTEWTFAPETEESLLDLRLEGKRGTATVRFLFVVCNVLERKVAFTPSLPDLWFEVARGQDLRERATAVLTRFFRDQEKADGPGLVPAAVALTGKAWTTTIEVAVAIPTLPQKKKADPWAWLTEEETLSGEEELERVGRCLDRLYPDDLVRAVLRERELEELTRLLRLPDRRPVLLVGPRQVGKTALIHEYVYCQAAQRRRRSAGSRQLWLLSPQRLVSGMSYVGQWEKRLLAIVEEAGKRDHVLYFDDLVGLCFAGITCNSDLNMAQVLKPHLDRRSVRVLGELTPEAFRVLKEKDRGFIDLFHVLPVAEPSEAETLRILVATQRQLEELHGCAFALEALPVAIDLQRRYASDLAFPGKVAGFLRQLAAKFRGANVGREQVLAEFAARSGLPQSFLDPESNLNRQDVVGMVGQSLVGQAEAVEAAADVIVTAGARLNDPQRPLGSLLFLGPTGVGKTQCAKAVARLLFGDAERLVRFDLNEFVSTASAARLVGTFDQPEGLLTAAVRRQPFCVLLFDEIEKAHPDVLDLLLAVLGEGRLTDALGRTANFTNALVIMTSNLGARESRHRLGFREDMKDDREVYLDAARKFFRPEFFNRIDRLVPFQPLDRRELERIAEKLIDGILDREGLCGRQRVIHIHQAALDVLVVEGYHPQLGARALKRALERHLVQPLGARFASLAPGIPCVTTIYPRAGTLGVDVEPLTFATPRPGTVGSADLSDPTEVMERAAATLKRIESQHQRPASSGPIALECVSSELEEYFAFREFHLRTRQLLQELRGDSAAQPQLGSAVYHGGRAGKSRRLRRPYREPDRRVDLEASSFDEAVEDLLQPQGEADSSETWDPEDASSRFFSSLPADQGLERLVAGIALLSAALANQDCRSEWLLVTTQFPVRRLAERQVHKEARLERGYANVWSWLYGYGGWGDSVPKELEGCELGSARCSVLCGPTAGLFAEMTSGTRLVDEPKRPGLRQSFALPVPESMTARAVLQDLGARLRRWLEALARGEATMADNPLPLKPVIDVGESGLFPLSGLPLPPEFLA